MTNPKPTAEMKEETAIEKFAEEYSITREKYECMITDLTVLLASEVDRVIEERMPSEDEMSDEADRKFSDVTNPHIFGKQLGFGECYFWFRNRIKGKQ